MSFAAHVNEVIDDHTAQVPQPELPSDLAGRLQIQLVGRFFRGIIRSEATAVDIDGHEGFGRVDDN